MPSLTDCGAPVGHLDVNRWLKWSWSFAMKMSVATAKLTIKLLTACWRVSPIRSDIGCVSRSFGDKLLHACTITNMSSTPIPANKHNKRSSMIKVILPPMWIKLTSDPGKCKTLSFWIYVLRGSVHPDYEHRKFSFLTNFRSTSLNGNVFTNKLD